MPIVLLFIALLLSYLSSFKAAFVGTTITPKPNLASDISPYYILDQIAPVIGSFNSIFIVRITFGLSVAWFDAIAPFHNSAVGLYSDLRQSNTPSCSTTNKNLAILFATRRVLNSLVPGNSFIIDNYLYNAGIDPNGADFNNWLSSVDPTTPYGIGNLAGIAVVNSLESDASNQLGKLPKSKYNNVRYKDYTGFVPVNSDYTISDPRYWQPNFISDGNGIITYQAHVAPQIALVNTISVDPANPAFVSKLSTARASTLQNFASNVLPLLNDVLSINANLNDQTKIQAEFYNNKGQAFVPALKFIGTSRSLSIDDYIHAVFTISVAVYDAGLFAWKNKIRINSVRPVTAARILYGDNPLPAAWGGVGIGTVTDISGNDWKPYISTPAHTDYPSGSAIYYSAFANTAKLVFNGDDTFGFSRTFAPGSSSVEPGLTPKTSVTIVAPTFTAYEADGGFARVLGGVHFRKDVVESQRIGKLVAPYAYALAQQLIRGTPAFSSAPSPIPTAIPTAVSTAVPSNGFLSQCGGLNFKGSTYCPPGYYCKYSNLYWSDCQKD